MTRLPDHEARLRAATDFGRNLVVTAGAGTGKTSLLVERTLTALGVGRVEIEQLAAITFTEKAAGELRQRLAEGLEALHRASRDDAPLPLDQPAGRALAHLRERFGVPRETVAERALRALEGLERAEVQTIHGFCSNLLHAHPFEARVEPDFQVDAAGEVEARVFEETWEAFLARELGPSASRRALWEAVLPKLTLSEIEAIARALASFGVPETLFRPSHTPSAVGAWLERTLRALVDDLRAFEGKGTAVKAERAAELRGVLQEILDGRVPRLDLERAEALLKSVPERKDFERALPRPRAQRLRSLLRLLIRHLAGLDEETLAKAVALAAPCAREAREGLLREGFLSFDALLALTRDLLRDHTAVRRQLKRRFRMLLVDEFQDTDPLQYEIVLFLAEEEGSHATDPYTARLEPGKLFLVGDPKQSIYRFRGADYAAYRRAVERVLDQGGEELVLRANFRSVSEILRPINRLFMGTGLWEHSPYQPRYEPIESARQDAGEPRVEIWTVSLEEDDGADVRRRAEGRILARAIQRLIAENECQPKDITILLRAFSDLRHYVAPLRRAGVPFIVDGGREFYERAEVRELLAVLRAVALPEDPVALLAFLRSPCGGVSDEELARYAREGGPWSLYARPDAERFPSLAGALDLLRRLHERAQQLPADEVVWMILRETELLTLNAAAYEGPQRVANLEKLASQAVELGRSGERSLLELVEFLQEGRTGEAEAESPLADENINAVRVMTIHKAKGLENRIVFVPDLARGSHQHDREGPVHCFTAPDGTSHLAIKAGDLVNAPRAAWACEETLHQEAEDLRVLYVAFTRAQERLILLVGRPSKRSGVTPYLEVLGRWGYTAKKPPEDGALLCDGLVRHHLVEAEEPIRLEREEPGFEEQAVARWQRDVETARSAAPPLTAASTEELWREEAPAARRPARSGSGIARAVGVAVHRLLERWDARDEEALRGAVARVVEELDGLDPAERPRVEREVAQRIEAFLASELPGVLRQRTVVGRELPLLLHDERGRSFKGTLDLLYREADGAYVIADYKTDQDASPEELAERYGPQLAVYARAVQRALELPGPPRQELWHLTRAKAHRLVLAPRV